MDQLTLAKTIADNPDAHSMDQIRDAWLYLSKTRSNGGMRSSDRASTKLERRLARLLSALDARAMVTA